jgi:hypothetical protein
VLQACIRCKVRPPVPHVLPDIAVAISTVHPCTAILAFIPWLARLAVLLALLGMNAPILTSLRHLVPLGIQFSFDAITNSRLAFGPLVPWKTALGVIQATSVALPLRLPPLPRMRVQQVVIAILRPHFFCVHRGLSATRQQAKYDMCRIIKCDMS